jgi:hypothetical protein
MACSAQMQSCALGYLNNQDRAGSIGGVKQRITMMLGC